MREGRSQRRPSKRATTRDVKYASTSTPDSIRPPNTARIGLRCRYTQSGRETRRAGGGPCFSEVTAGQHTAANRAPRRAVSQSGPAWEGRGRTIAQRPAARRRRRRGRGRAVCRPGGNGARRGHARGRRVRRAEAAHRARRHGPRGRGGDRRRAARSRRRPGATARSCAARSLVAGGGELSAWRSFRRWLRRGARSRSTRCARSPSWPSCCPSGRPASLPKARRALVGRVSVGLRDQRRRGRARGPRDLQPVSPRDLRRPAGHGRLRGQRRVPRHRAGDGLGAGARHSGHRPRPALGARSRPPRSPSSRPASSSTRT